MKFRYALVTGGAGFIGSHLIEALLNEKIKVICVDDLSKGKLENIKPFLNNATFQLVKADITDYDAICPHFKNIDVVFHLAASKNTVCLKDPKRDLLVNAMGAFNVLKASSNAKVKRFIHVSTGSVYGEPKISPQNETHPLSPVSYYGVSKLAGERYAMVFYSMYKLPVTILRYYHVYGPKQDCSDEGGVVAIFVTRLHKGLPPIIYGDGTQVRSFTYVKDTVRATLFIAQKDDTIGQVYNIASGLKISINELANTLKNSIGGNVKPVYKDWKLGDIRFFDMDNSALRNLGFEFKHSFEKGLEETREWFRKLSEYHE